MLKKIKVQTWMLGLIVILQIGVMFFWLEKKEGVYIDEMFSLESAHYLGESVTRLTDLEKWDGEGDWHTVEDFNKHFTVSNEEAFLKMPFEKKIDVLCNVSLYKVLLNITLSMTAGEYSLIQLILLNVISFVILQFILYRLGVYIFHNNQKALLIPLFFGFSAGAVNMVLYVRMYVLVMLFSTVLIWLHLLLLDSQRLTSYKTVLLYLGILIIGYVGYKLHQYMGLLAVALTIAYSCIRCFNKQRNVGILHLGVLGTLGGIFIVKTGIWKSFFYGTETSRAKQAMELILNKSLGEWIGDFWGYWQIYLKNALGGIGTFLVIVIIVLMAVSYRKGKENMLWLPWEKREKQALLLILISYVCFIVMLSRVSPGWRTRWISYLFPAGAVVIAILSSHILRDVPRRQFWCGTLGIVCVMIFASGKYGYIENLYEEIEPMKSILQEEKYQLDNIYVNSTQEDSLRWRQIYCDGYLWQEGLRYYVTTPEMLRKHIAPEIEKCEGNAVLLWVDEDEDTYEILKDLYDLAGFDSHDKLGYTQESKVYYLTREDDGWE